ncbi:Vacuolar protein sorting-associated protein 26 [Mycoemilia scoparia]|uniref:Vacuolar protein sorting-associated protein 26 n=1 Tax=Mycoemilia scoparia TaxID=417184 RepID=A0A9W8DMY5_9FUNG|nr:Vacuolar protein sorting-associated protein 26 [Mycoemilia scoparia]
MALSEMLGFGPRIDIRISLDGENKREQIEYRAGKDKKEKAPLYFDGESVHGKVNINVGDGKHVEHYGIKVQFVGSIETFYDRSTQYEFVSLGQELASPGVISGSSTYSFNFKNVEKQYESYQGINVKLRYFIRVTISRRMRSITADKDVWVYSYKMPPHTNHTIKMEVGIEDCLHIEFEYNRSKYHLKDVIIGKISFLLVRIKIKHMELAIIRRETTGSIPNQYNESETITKFEIMDGAPVKGEVIPIRLFLGGFEITPTYRDINKKFSTRYYLNLVLIDEENRRYFKQQEITFFRKPEGEQDDVQLIEPQGEVNQRKASNVVATDPLSDTPKTGDPQKASTSSAQNRRETPAVMTNSTVQQESGKAKDGDNTDVVA